MSDTPTADVLVRFPVLEADDRIVIGRAGHGGWVASLALSPYIQRNAAVFSTTGEMQAWLAQVLKRWKPLVELIPPAPRDPT